ncbi:MAG: ABC transporter permease [Aeromicrobium sp.]|nr:ABC transporter permease [Burkholderiales bacterium]
MQKLSLAIKLLRRNAHAGEAQVLIVALLIAVASVTTVSFFADRVESALNRQANELIAADAIVRSDKLVVARFTEEALRQGLVTAETVTFPSMVSGDAARGQGVNLAEIKAVSNGFPLRGKLRITDTPGTPDRDAESVPEVGTTWVPDILLTRLGAAVGDRLKVGAVELTVTKVLTKEPDSVLDYFGIAPRVLINIKDISATNLIQVGSRVNYAFLVAGEKQAVDRFALAFAGKLKRGERLETVRDARSEVRVALERAQRFLGLAALLSVILASVAVALAARRFSQRQLDSAAMMRCLGATQADIFALNFWQFIILGVSACLVGTLAGFVAQSGLAALLTGFFTVSLPAPTIVPALQGLAIGMVLLLGFTLPPLLSLRKVPTLRVLRRDLDPFDGAATFAYLLGFVTLAALIVWRSGDVKLGSIAVGGFVIALAVAAGAGWLLIQFAASMRGAVSGSWRYGVANMKRRSGASLVQIMALGLGIMAMLLLTLVRTDLIARWQGSVSSDMPNRFVINIQTDQLAAVRAFFAERKMATPDLYPMIRGRLVSVAGTPVAQRGYTEERGKRLAEREFNLSWADKMQADNKIVAGKFWAADDTTPQFSVEDGLATTLNIKIGDELTYDVAGSRFTAKVTSLRKVEWDSFKANFFVIANRGVLDSYPASYITSFHLAPGNEALVTGLIRQFPNLSVIDLTAIMNQVRIITDQVANAVSFVFMFALAAGLVVLYAAIATTQDERVFDAAVMRTLGANRRQMVILQLAEFLAIGLMAGLIASVGAMSLAAVLSERVLSVPYVINWWIPVIGVLGGGLGIAVAGLIGTRKAVDSPPLATIRGLA